MIAYFFSLQFSTILFCIWQGHTKEKGDYGWLFIFFISFFSVFCTHIENCVSIVTVSTVFPLHCCRYFIIAVEFFFVLLWSKWNVTIWFVAMRIIMWLRKFPPARFMCVCVCTCMHESYVFGNGFMGCAIKKTKNKNKNNIAYKINGLIRSTCSFFLFYPFLR